MKMYYKKVFVFVFTGIISIVLLSPLSLVNTVLANNILNTMDNSKSASSISGNNLLCYFTPICKFDYNIYIYHII